MKRIGLLTSGGDCQALNATMRGVVKGLSANLDELEVYGFMNGYKGLDLWRLPAAHFPRFFRYSHEGWYNSRFLQTAVQAHA